MSEHLDDGPQNGKISHHQRHSTKTYKNYLKAPTFYQDSLSSAMWSSCEAPFVDDFCCICCFW